MAVYIRSKAFLTFTLDVLFDIFISIARAVARLKIWGVWGWGADSIPVVSCWQRGTGTSEGVGRRGYLPSLPDTSYKPASNHCSVLEKLLFNELLTQATALIAEKFRT